MNAKSARAEASVRPSNFGPVADNERSERFIVDIPYDYPASAPKVSKGRLPRKASRGRKPTVDQIKHILEKVGGKMETIQKVDDAAYRLDSRSVALLRGVEIAEQDLIDAGGAYSLEQVSMLMHGISRQAVEKRLREGSLIAVPGPRNRRHYPAAQFKSDGMPVAGLKDVRDALPSRNPWFVLNFLVNPDSRLGGRRPIDMLKEGRIEQVVEAAQGLAVQGS